MKKITKINMLGCSDLNEDEQEVGKIFNVLKLSDQMIGSFSIIGSIVTNDIADEMNYHFVIIRVTKSEKGQLYRVLGSINGQSDDGDIYCNDIFKMSFRDIDFPEKGEYNILAFRYDEKEKITMDDVSDLMITQEPCGVFGLTVI